MRSMEPISSGCNGNGNVCSECLVTLSDVHLQKFTDVSFGLPIKLTKDEAHVRIVANFVDQDQHTLTINCHVEVI